MTMTTGIHATQIDQFGISLPVVLIGPIQRQIGGYACALLGTSADHGP